MLENLLISCCFVELHSQVKRVNVFIEGISQKKLLGAYIECIFF